MNDKRCADCRRMEIDGDMMKCTGPMPWAMDTDPEAREVPLVTAFEMHDCQFFMPIKVGDSA